MTGLPPQVALNICNAGQLLRYWRTELGYTQKELAEVLMLSRFYICEQERGTMPTPDRTLNQVALLYAIHSLPPDAPVSILQDMLTPQSVLDRRAKAQARLAKRMAKGTKRKRQSSKSGRQVPRRSSAGRQRS